MRHLARLMVRLYPRAFRTRYGDELALALTGPRHALIGLWAFSANQRVDSSMPRPVHISLVILNPALVLALTLARWRGEGEGQGAQRAAQRAV